MTDAMVLVDRLIGIANDFLKERDYTLRCGAISTVRDAQYAVLSTRWLFPRRRPQCPARWIGCKRGINRLAGPC